MASKWGDPEIGIERDLMGRPIAGSVAALEALSREKAQKSMIDALEDKKTAARNRRIDYWARRGQASWQEPDYEGEDIAERDRISTDQRLDAMQRGGDIQGGLAEKYEPGAFARKAEGADYADDLEDQRYWTPRHQSRLADDYARKYALMTAPATIAGQSRENVATTGAGAKMGEARTELQGDSLSALAKLIGAGMFGTDPKTGDTIAPPPEAQAQIMEALRRAMAGGQSETFNPGMEQEIAGAMEASGASRQEVIAHFRKIGRIR